MGLALTVAILVAGGCGRGNGNGKRSDASSPADTLTNDAAAGAPGGAGGAGGGSSAGGAGTGGGGSGQGGQSAAQDGRADYGAIDRAAGGGDDARLADTPASDADQSEAPVAGAACNGAATSDLPGVSLVFPDDRCTYTLAEAAAGITITYQLTVLHDLDGICSSASDYYGRCERPDQLIGLIVGFDIAGDSQRYCPLCDLGRCALQTFTFDAVAGTYPLHIYWDGRNWLGPSDTANHEGAPFPPGTYTLTLNAVGTWDGPGTGDAGISLRDGGTALSFQVTAKRFITITP